MNTGFRAALALIVFVGALVGAATLLAGIAAHNGEATRGGPREQAPARPRDRSTTRHHAGTAVRT